MPLFEYVCRECQKESELLVRSARDPRAACPHCGSKKLTRKLSVFARPAAAAKPDLAPCGRDARACESCSPHHRH